MIREAKEIHNHWNSKQLKLKVEEAKAYLFWYIFKARPTYERECEQEDISSSITKRPKPVIILLTCEE